jgi:two-component system nitrogen regulation sensor histidine kinase GlnL
MTSVAVRRPAPPPIDMAAVVDALPDPVLVVDGTGQIRAANPASEAFFDVGVGLLRQRRLADLVPFGSPITALTDQVRRQQSAVSEFAIELVTPRLGRRLINAHAVPLPELDDAVVLRLDVPGIASRMDRQVAHAGAARSVAGMAAMLAHEVKNPLSGIRGAAQLLEANCDEQDRELTQLICTETDRICGLVDRMDSFADDRPLERGKVNIHEVLAHVRRVAEAGFGSHAKISEDYDPSLPPVYGNRDQLIQVFLNLLKNAAEAVPQRQGEIHLRTSYRHGVRLALPGSRDRIRLALEVAVSDNGGGIPEDLLPVIFDPFVTTKTYGSGLGLALAAKIAGDHSGLIEADVLGRGSRIRVVLPIHDERAEE